MYIYVYVCIYMYVYVCICMYIYVCIYMYVYIYVCIILQFHIQKVYNFVSIDTRISQFLEKVIDCFILQGM